MTILRSQRQSSAESAHLQPRSRAGQLAFAILAALLMACFARGASGELWTWTGVGGDGQWTTSTNWQDRMGFTGTPADLDSVVIGVGHNVTMSSVTVTLGELTSESTLQTGPGASLTLLGVSTHYVAYLNANQGVVNIIAGGLLTVDYLATGSDGSATINGPGSLTTNNGATTYRLTLANALNVVNGGVWTQYGDSAPCCVKQLILPANGTFINNGTMTLPGGGWRGGLVAQPGLTFENHGTLSIAHDSWMIADGWTFMSAPGSTIDIYEIGHNNDMFFSMGASGHADFYGTINLKDGTTYLGVDHATFHPSARINSDVFSGEELSISANSIINVDDPEGISVPLTILQQTEIQSDLELQNVSLATVTIPTGVTLVVNGDQSWNSAPNIYGSGTLHTKGTSYTKAFFAREGLSIVNDGWWAHYFNHVDGSHFYFNMAGGSSGSLTNNGTMALQNRGIYGSGVPAPMLQNNGTIILYGGGLVFITGCAFANPGTLETQDGSSVSVEGTLVSYDVPTSTLFEGIYDITGQLYIPTGNVLNQSATVIMRGSSAVFPKLGPTGLHVQGAGASLELHDSASHTIGGPFQLSDGSVLIDEPATLTVATLTQNSGQFELGGSLVLSAGKLAMSSLLGGVFEGYGTITGSLDNVGATLIPRTNPSLLPLSITGAYAQSAGATLQSSVYGAIPGGEFGQLAVAGSAALGGTIDLLFPGPLPIPGDEFQVVTYASQTGLFGIEIPDALSSGADLIKETLPTYWVARVQGLYNAASLKLASDELWWLDPTNGLDKDAGFGTLPFATSPVDSRLSSVPRGGTLFALLDQGASQSISRIDARTGALELEVPLTQDLASIAAGDFTPSPFNALVGRLVTLDPETAAALGGADYVGRGLTASVRSSATTRYTQIGKVEPALGIVERLVELSFGAGGSATPELDLIAYSPGSVLYGLDVDALELWVLDLSDGSADFVGSVSAGLAGVDGMSFLGDELWFSRASDGALFQINPSNGSDIGVPGAGAVGNAGLTRRDCLGAESSVFVARDKPFDSGGEIHLVWTGYSPPVACTSLRFVVSRSTDPCVLTMGNPDFVVEILEGGGTSYGDTTVLDYFRYFYRLQVWGIPDGSTDEVLVDVQYSNAVSSRPNLLISEVRVLAGTPKVGEEIELQNLSTSPIDLTGFRLSNGSDFESLSGIVPADGFIVIALATLTLDPVGDALTLLPPDGSDYVIDSVAWGDEGGAPAAPSGFTIQRVDGTDADDPDYASFEVGRETLGAANDVPAPALGTSLLFNEVYYAGGAGVDYLEIMNPLGMTVVLDSLAISDGAGFLEYIGGLGDLSPGELLVLDAGSLDPFTRDLTATTLYLYQLTSTGALQRIDQLGWGSTVTELVPPAPVVPNDAVVRSPDGAAVYLGEQGANWYDSGGGDYLFYGPQSPGQPNTIGGEVALSVDPMGAGDYTTIGAALAAASPGTRILVQPGVYPESLVLSPGVDLVGLVENGEPVLLTGDGLSPAIMANGLDTTTRLSNLVVQSAGGGMQLTNSSIVVSNVSFLQNETALDGGAIWIDGGAPDFTSCLFQENQAVGNGGAVHVVSGTPDFRYCLFVLNSAVDGAAIHQAGGSSRVEHCVFDRNDATGGVLHASGGSILSEHSIVTESTSGAALRAPSGANGFSCGIVFDEAASTPLEETAVAKTSVLEEDPLFCQPSLLNYTYPEESPAMALTASCGATIGIAGPPCALSVTSAPGVPLVGSRLLPAAPNPFNPATQLSFELSRGGRVDLEIYDVRGRRVAQPLAGVEYGAGLHTVRWQGEDHRGQTMASGVYFVALRVDGRRVGESQKLVLLK